MCRWLVYKGGKVALANLITKPEHSLAHQSVDASYHPGCHDPDRKRNIRVNGDGFGVAWYREDRIESGACVFRCISPAWNNANLRNIAEFVDSHLVFAHVRASDMGGGAQRNSFSSDISEDNCHPFKHKRYTFMHNGGISQFGLIKRTLRSMLPDEMYNMIAGSTDSEHAFALLLDEIGDTDRELTQKELADAVERTINRITRLSRSFHITAGSSLNFAVTDGRHLIATRCRTNTLETPPSLYYCIGSNCIKDTCGTPDDKAIIISSEPLTRCTDQWKLLPKNHMIVVEYDPDHPQKVGQILLRSMRVEEINPAQRLTLGAGVPSQIPVEIALCS